MAELLLEIAQVGERTEESQGQMKICYGASFYRSFANAAEKYRMLISESWELISSPEIADVVIIHGDPLRLPLLYEKYRMLANRYVIGYVTWEADPLPNIYLPALSLLQEVWTCSEYCASILRQACANTRVIPHVISRDMHFSLQDLNRVKSLVPTDQFRVTFLAITHTRDKRKNIKQLIDTFSIFHQRHPDALLVIKGFGNEPRVMGAGVCSISLDMTDAELNALYHLSSIYVSVHHSEGWGLTMSDAQLFRLPVVATAYSGNLDYMTSETAYLISCQIKEIAPDDRAGLFQEGMRWAYCDQEAILAALEQAYEDHVGCRDELLLDRAAGAIKKFDETRIKAALDHRLGKIEKAF